MKTKLPALPSGARYCTLPDGSRHCTGSQMGRPDSLPPASFAGRLRLVRLRWFDGDYDEGGAYWGCGKGGHIYRAIAVLPCKPDDWDGNCECFVRAGSRQAAKAAVLAKVPGARFYQ
jgi:hypothetical protein